MSSDCDGLLREVSNIGWFQEAGRSLEGLSAQRIESWAHWPGPGFAGVEQLALDLQSVKEEIEREVPGALSTWDECINLAVEAVGKFVPGYAANQDSWHAPTAAVWHAAWVLSLQSVLVASARPVPEAVKDQMAWFARGRWPSAYTAETVSAANRAYLVL